MAYDQLVADRVRQALGDKGPIVEKTMFGSLGFMVRGKLSVCVRKENVMYKVGERKANEAIDSGEAEPVNMRDRVMKDWVYVDNSKLDEASEFKKWLNLALNFNKSQS